MLYVYGLHISHTGDIRNLVTMGLSNLTEGVELRYKCPKLPALYSHPSHTSFSNLCTFFSSKT